MKLVAKSGTPLFISGQPEATGNEQKQAVKESFKIALQHLLVGEPFDRLENPLPIQWKLNNKIENINCD